MTTRSRTKLLVLLILLALLSTALWLPQRPWIEDALSQAPAAGYSVHLPAGRIILEPFLGPLLFLSRADDPLQLVLWIALWLMAATLVFALFQARRSGAAFAQALGTAVKWLPVSFILYAALLLVFLFSPFPSSTIEHQKKDIVLVNLHSHSYHSHDGIISPLRLMHWHARNGFDAFFITEHNNHRATLELVEAQKAGDLPAEPLLLAGEEYSGSNHLLLLGLTRDFNSKDYTDQAAIDSARAQGGVAMLAHWFAPQRNTRPLADYCAMGVDGFEIANQAEGIYYPEKYTAALRQAAQEHGLLLTGNPDYHGYGPACLVWNALHLPGWQGLEREERAQAILDLLRRRDQSRVQVLLYRDRKPIPAGLACISPLITLLDYFRSLRPVQMLAWLAWLGLLLLFIRSVRRIPEQLRIPIKPLELLSIAGAGAAAVTVLFGLWMLVQHSLLSGENRIFLNYGTWLSITGILLFIYCIALLKNLKKLNIF